jgi:hypothetical protein
LLRCSESFETGQKHAKFARSCPTSRIVVCTRINRRKNNILFSGASRQYPGTALTLTGAAEQTLAKY